MPTLTEEIPISDEGTTSSIDDFDGFLAAATLLQQPRLARHYVYICYYGPTTVQELIDTLDVARATAYDDVEHLETLSLVERDESIRPHELTAEAFAFVDQAELAITPTVLHAVALTEIDDDLAYFQNRYGIGRLAQALRPAGKHYAGQLTQRQGAEELGIAPAEGMAVVQALRPALATGQQFDPYFGRLFPDIADEIDLAIDRVQPRLNRTDE